MKKLLKKLSIVVLLVLSACQPAPGLDVREVQVRSADYRIYYFDFEDRNIACLAYGSWFECDFDGLDHE